MLTGRFETMDPAPGDIFNPGMLHKYVYAQDNAVNRLDPTGLQDFEEEWTLEEATNNASKQLRLTHQLQYSTCVRTGLVNLSVLVALGAFGEGSAGTQLFYEALHQVEVHCAELLAGWPIP
jgi:hypothetical protein